MRLHAIGIMAFWVGLFLFFWGVLAFLAAAACVGGGAPGQHPIASFAFKHFLSAGLLMALVGARKSAKSEGVRRMSLWAESCAE